MDKPCAGCSTVVPLLVDEEELYVEWSYHVTPLLVIQYGSLEWEILSIHSAHSVNNPHILRVSGC
jgi:hypothetical protein